MLAFLRSAKETEDTGMKSELAEQDQTHNMAKQTLRLAFLLTLFILAAELSGGIIAHSLALLSDAGHVLTDLFALGLAWFAVVQAERPANEQKTFGYHRVGILVALANAVTLILISLIIVWEAIQRFQYAEPIQPLIMFLAAGVGIAVNLFLGFGLQKQGNNLNMRAAALHVFGDVGASIGVVIAGLIIFFTGWTLADPLLSIGIAGLIAVGAWPLLREIIEILLEATPRGINLATLVQDMTGIEGVQDVHDVHVWSIASGLYALSCHVLIDDIPPSQSASLLHALETLLAEKYQIGHTTIQFESHPEQEQPCSVDGLYRQLKTTNGQARASS
jgi:cobalt-zinc-cadmium efflux system protein